MSIKSYSEMIEIPTFEERFEYLKLGGTVGEMTFNGRRYLNQKLYKCNEWLTTRRRVILRDKGCDLACEGYEIFDSILVHHINPITIADILERRPCVFDLENLISTTFETHEAIHYGDKELLPKPFVERTKNDTCLWR